MTPAARAAVDAAAAVFNVPADSILGSSRNREYFLARCSAMLILSEAGYSLPYIGSALGRHHSSVKSAVDRAASLGDDWRKKHDAAKLLANVPPPAKVISKTSRPSFDENHDIAVRCRAMIEDYWRRAGVPVRVDLEPATAHDGSTVWRVKSEGIPISGRAK